MSDDTLATNAAPTIVERNDVTDRRNVSIRHFFHCQNSSRDNGVFTTIFTDARRDVRAARNTPVNVRVPTIPVRSEVASHENCPTVFTGRTGIGDLLKGRLVCDESTASCGVHGFTVSRTPGPFTDSSLLRVSDLEQLTVIVKNDLTSLTDVISRQVTT